MKLGSKGICPVPRWGMALWVTLVLSSCASTPSRSVNERLDPDTGTTVTLIERPVELLASSVHVTAGDPFAFFAPFETNRMGERALYLWVSAPAVQGTHPEPRLLCDGQPLDLKPVAAGLEHFNLSQAPYAAPAPWSAVWYFQLPQQALDCLVSARFVTLETRVTPEAAPEGFVVEAKGLASVRSFNSSLLLLAPGTCGAGCEHAR